MLIANEKWSIGTGNGPSSEVVNNPSAFLAVKQKSGFVQWSAEENSTGATWGMHGGSQGGLIQGLFYCFAGFVIHFCARKRFTSL